MANQALFTPNRAVDANTYALPGATATFYLTGTMTPILVYSDVAGMVPATNPVVADGSGVFPQTYFNGDAKVIVRDVDGATVWTLDPIPATSGDATGAANVSFAPTVDLPQTNVQDAIEAAAALAIAGVTDFGLGVTGNAPTIANIDALGTASGMYRFTGTSTGTFPAGVTAATTGLVRIDRQTAAEAVMYLRAAGGSKYFVRHMSATVWGAWQGQIDDSTLVTSTETIGANDNDTTIPTSAAVIDYVAAVIPVQVNFNALDEPTGTYSQSGTTITVTMTAHGMAVGQGVTLDFTSGTATDGFFIIQTSVNANTFTVTAGSPATTSGNVTRKIWARKAVGISNFEDLGSSILRITFTTPFANANYVYFFTASADTGNRQTLLKVVDGTPPTATQLTFQQYWEIGSSGGIIDVKFGTVVCIG
jgi:hypothetical protein